MKTTVRDGVERLESASTLKHYQWILGFIDYQAESVGVSSWIECVSSESHGAGRPEQTFLERFVFLSDWRCGVSELDPANRGELTG